MRIVWLTTLLAAACAAQSGQAQPVPPVRQFFKERLQLTDREIAQVQRGNPITREVRTPDRAEILLYGVVHINAEPETFVRAYGEVEARVDGKGFLQARRFKPTPTIDELSDARLEPQDLKELRDCEPGDCVIQLTAKDIELFRTRVDWGSPEAAKQANHLFRELTLDRLKAYQAGGNAAMGVYRDNRDAVDVGSAFRTLVDRARNLPNYLPAFQQYLLDYPKNMPADTREFFYWMTVKFSLRPTLLMNHVVIHQPPKGQSSWMIADKQVYATHYFQTALDLYLCIQERIENEKGFYLVTLKGARFDGLTGFTGRLLRLFVIRKTQDVMLGQLARLKAKTEAAR